jgi:putative ABC transport system permease protein
VGLAIANGFTAMAGSIYCQHKGFFEISVGTGTMVIGLASVIIGIQLLTPESGSSMFSHLHKKELRPTTAVIIGSIVYKACISAAISMGMEANDLKLITSILFLIILIVSTERRRSVKGHA